MLKRATLIAAILLCCSSNAFAMYGCSPGGKWPTNWPKELEPLRKQAYTCQGGLVNWVWYDIPFATREEFEAAWPHILKVKTKGAAIRLMCGPYINAKTPQSAGVSIRVQGADPPQMKIDAATTEIKHVTTPGVKPIAVELLLVIDGEIVDLNRIKIPADTPIIDDRLKPSREPSAR